MRSRAAGAEIVDVEVPAFTYGLTAYYLIAPAEASSNLARYDGVRFGHRVEAPDTNAMYMATRTDGFGAEVKRRIMLGTYALSAGYYDAYYGKALKGAAPDHRRRLRSGLRGLRRLVVADLALCRVPVRRQGRPVAMYLNDTATIPSNLAGHPAISVPFGFGRQGLPVGVQVLGPLLSEARLLAVSAVLQAASHPRRGVIMSSTAGHDRTTRVEHRTECMDHRESGAGRGHLTERRVGDGDRSRGPRRAGHRDQAVLGCPNRFGDDPNTNVDPVCLGLPGTLPVLNGKAVELAMKLGLALNCTVQRCVFARKNYFYPDMPKDYQISQYDRPLNVDGWLELPDGHRVASSGPTWRRTPARAPTSAIRVASTTPATRWSTTTGPACRCWRSCQPPRHPGPRGGEGLRRRAAQILVATGVSDAKMEEGSMRVDANVSVRPAGSDELRTRCEIKNVNSLRSLGRAIDYEAQRHVDLYENGDRPVQETRHWDEEGGRTRAGAIQGAGRGLSLLRRSRSRSGRSFTGVDRGDPVIAATSAGERRLGLVEHRCCRRASGDHGREGRLDELAVRRHRRRRRSSQDRQPCDQQPVGRRWGGDRLDPAGLAALVTMETGGELTATQAKTVLAEMVRS
jgi:aspartyl-tRNA(Asn)/glutamyl-tRNA(Gln) amidotransferase subunit B